MTARSKKQPLYDQLVDILTEKIENTCSPGDLLPSERELSEHYGLSRTTVRLALQELERQGLVVRQHGRGTFVADRSAKTTDLLHTYSFTEQMREMGRTPSTAILSFEEIDADKSLAKHMSMHLGERVVRFKRLRSADGMPLMVETTHLPARIFPGFTREMLEGRSLYEVIEDEFGQRVRVAEEEFFASVARMSDAVLLEIDEGDPVLDLVRFTSNTQDEVIEYTTSVARADQFKYRVYHYRAEA